MGSIFSNHLVRKAYRSYLFRFLYYIPSEIISRIKGNHNPLIPSKWRIYTGRGDFLKIGEEFFTYFKKFGGLEPDFCILDIGSGLGRMALPFTKFLSTKGCYHGVEIVKSGVTWSTNHISESFSNFIFTHSDIKNLLYNKNGQYDARSYVFPYERNSYDFIFLTSVFTHMHPDEIKHYLTEIHRLLKPGRRCLFTCNIINEESLNLLAQGKSCLDFKHKFENYYSLTSGGSTDDVGLVEAWLLDTILKCQLTLVEPIQWGNWCGRDNYLSCQDILVVEKK